MTSHTNAPGLVALLPAGILIAALLLARWVKRHEARPAPPVSADTCPGGCGNA